MPVPGALGPDPADGAVDGDDDVVDVRAVVVAGDAVPLVAAIATPAAPAPIPAARNAVKTRRLTRPPLLADAISYLPSPAVPAFGWFAAASMRIEPAGNPKRRSQCALRAGFGPPTPASRASGPPSGALPSGALPSGALPSGALPSGALPSGALPSGAGPIVKLP